MRVRTASALLNTANYKCFLRLFDVNFDGFIDKKEFRWMTTSDTVSWKTIDLVFEVRIKVPHL